MGDRIRLSHEGVLTHISKSYINDSTLLTLDNEATFALTEGRYDVEILERAKRELKVGDEVRGRDYEEAVQALPRGSVLSSEATGRPLWVRTISGWQSLVNNVHVDRLDDADRKILYIPEE